jgi:hypothetical protein
MSLPNLDTLIASYWRMGDLRYKLDKLQRKIHGVLNQNAAKKVLILSSRQIGKSYTAVVMALEFAIKNPGTVVRIVAPTLKQCSDIIRDNLVPICQDAPKGFIEQRRSENRWDLFNSSSLRVGALERAHVDGNRGANAAMIIYEEPGFVSGDDFTYGVNSVLGPQLLRSNGREIFVTSPSEDPDHPIHTQILPECESRGTAFRYTVYDSPSITPPQIEEAARRCGGYETEAFKREYLAEIIRPVTLMVIPDYDPRRHVVPFTVPASCIWNVTIDWGGVRDLTVALLHTYDFLSNKYLVWDEKKWPANTPTNTIVQELKDWERDYFISTRWADVPGQIQVDLNSMHDYQIVMPPKSDWIASVNQMAVKFTTDKILIHPKCEFLQRSIRGGMFNKNRTDFERTADLGHMDALAALMYALRSQETENPYREQNRNWDHVFFPTADKTELDLAAEKLNPRTFGKFRDKR